MLTRSSMRRSKRNGSGNNVSDSYSEVSGLNLGGNTSYPGWGFNGSPQSLETSDRHVTLHYAMTASFYIIHYHPIIRRCIDGVADSVVR
jgi:hypothetical protein